MIATSLQGKKILCWMQLKKYAFNMYRYCFTEDGYADAEIDNSGVRGVGIADLVNLVPVDKFSPRFQFGFHGWGYFT